MVASEPKSVIFLACVNTYRSGKRLRHFVNERKAIARMFSSFSRKAPFQAVEKGNISNQSFFNLLQQNDYYQRVAVMHFVGPANGNHLRIETDKFEAGIHMDELSKLIALLPNLQVVFLSGCATPDLIEMLIRRDIPAVLVTQTTEKNTEASNVALRFYRYLSQGKSIQEAVKQVQTDFSQFRNHQLRYNIETDEFEWNKSSKGDLPWGVYYLADNASRMETAVYRPQINFPIDKIRGLRKGMQMIKFGFAALILGLLAAGITIYFQTPEQLVQIQQALAL